MKSRFSPATSLFLIFVLAVAFLLTQVPHVVAAPPFTPPGKAKQQVTPTLAPTVFPTLTPTRISIVKPQVALTGGLLTACQSHEQVLKTRMDNLVRFATNMMDTFNRISLRVQEFYKNKVLTQGKTVGNYDALLADISVKQAVVKSDINIAQSDVNDFVCTGVDPKGHLTQFRIDMQSVKRSLKDYRTSIKNLIVAVHSVASESATSTPTGTEK